MQLRGFQEMDKKWMPETEVNGILAALDCFKTYSQLLERFPKDQVDQFLNNFDRYIDKGEYKGETTYEVDYSLHADVIRRYNSRLFPIFD